VGASLLAKAMEVPTYLLGRTLFQRPQKRPFLHKNGLSEVAKDRRKTVKFQ
jgi:hypothetical protein